MGTLTVQIFLTIAVSCSISSAYFQITDEDVDINRLLNESYIDSDEHITGNAKCQQMDIPFCENVGYNQTMLPNSLGHQTQQDVISEINIYSPLLALSCSPDLKLFLCTFYAPICFDHINESSPILLRPCKSLCESARQGCASHFRQINNAWPSVLNCDKFQEKGNGHTCVGKDDENHHLSSSSTINEPNGNKQTGVPRALGFVCPKNFELASYTLYLGGKNYTNCARPCDGVILDRSSAKIVRISSGIIAFIALLSTLFTCITFLSNSHHFKYPTKAIIVISACQLIVAACYLIGALTGNTIPCNDPVEPPKSLPNMEMIRSTTMGNKKGTCTLQFMALYFFQMSSVFWWLMMTVSFFMIAKLKWAPEAVGSVSRYFHMISWTIPALLAVYLAVLGNIEGDPLSGTCYVSFSDKETILGFVIVPMASCLIVGCILLAMGFQALWEAREILEREYGKQTDEHDRLIVRIRLFSILFVTFTTMLICFHYFERVNLDTWMLSWLSRICKSREYSIPCPVVDLKNQAPSYSNFILKYAATMAIGILSAGFMWTDKKLSCCREVSVHLTRVNNH